MFDIGPHGLDCGMVRVAVGQQAGNLAGDIGQSGKGMDVPAPGIELAARNVGDATVIEDELNVATGVRQLKGYGKLACQEAKVESESQLSESTDILDEAWLE